MPAFQAPDVVYPGLASEVEQLFPILASRPLPREYGIRPLCPEIDYCLRSHGDHLYLIAVNTSVNAIQATMQIEDETAVPDRVRLLFENREIELQVNRFTDTFTVYEPHVYELN